MAMDSPILISVPWPEHILNRYTGSPSAASTRSFSSSESSTAFSVDAPSTQSSVDSGSSRWYQADWLDKTADAASVEPTDQENSLLQENIRPCDFKAHASTHATPNAPEARQHPRRTRRLCSHDSSNGDTAPRPPPALVRQSDRKISFVDSLVDTTTQMVETIWPLSAHIQSRQPTECTRQPSKMELRYFIQEVLKRSKASYSTLQVALYYLVLIQPFVPKHDFTEEQPQDSAASFSLQCGRRMFIAALILASKYLQDRNFSASGWSKISGLSTWDLNVNETAFLTAIDWKLHVPDQLFHRWTDIVLRYSPSAHLHGTRSCRRPRLSWQEIVVRLTPGLDSVDLDDTELSDDSGYCSPVSPGSHLSPPPLPMRDEVVSRFEDPTLTPTPSRSVPMWLTQTPTTSQTPTHTTEPRPILPPLQPHLAALPTPELTPQSNPFCTPAVGALGGFPPRSSMRRAMCQVQEAAHARCTLDRMSEWKPRVAEGFPTLSPGTSLATSAFSSSPDSTSDESSQYSNISSRPSRSSSISSVASLNCAPAQPKSLAVQAARRCANMQSSGLKEATRPNTFHESPGQLPWQEFVAKTGMNYKSDSESACTVNPARIVCGTASSSFPVIISHVPQVSTSRKLPYSFDATLASKDHEAASALQDLALNSQTQSIVQRTDTRKRPRPNSMDLSVEGAVRNLIAPRYLTDITNLDSKSRPHSRSSGRVWEPVLADDTIADSFLLRKECKHAVRQAHKWFTKSAPIAQKVAGRGENMPRKRACAGSERGGRGEARAALTETSPIRLRTVR